MKHLLFSILVFSSSQILCADNSSVNTEKKASSEQEVALLDNRREDQIPLERRSLLENHTYLEAYLQAVVDMHYFDYQVRVKVVGETVELYNLPANEMLARSILDFVKDFPGVGKVVSMGSLKKGERKEARSSEEELAAFPKQENHLRGVWLPQQTVLFAPLVADPRQVTYSIGYRFHDKALGKEIVPVTFGDNFPIYRWINVGPYQGDMQISIEAGVWADFSLKLKDGGLINADYYVGFPLTYAYDRWSYRLRFAHMSSHLGDEFIVENPDVVRKNVSYEFLDLTGSYQLSDAVRLYAGAAVIVRYNKEYPMRRCFVNYGAEVRMLGLRSLFHRLYMQPFFAVNFANWQLNDWKLDQTYAFGVELSKLRGVGRKVRLYAEAHDGYSRAGQFQKLRSRYFALKFGFGF